MDNTKQSNQADKVASQARKIADQRTNGSFAELAKLSSENERQSREAAKRGAFGLRWGIFRFSTS